MYVIKSNGKQEEVKFEKIFTRIKQQLWDLDVEYVDAHRIAQLVIGDLKPGMTTAEIDELAAQTAASMTIKHPDYKKLAARLLVTALHKHTDKSFSKTVKKLHSNKNKLGVSAPRVSDKLYEIVKEHGDVIDSEIIHSRDFNFDYFGFKTLERSYLLKLDGKVVERPQYMWMRVALGIWGDNLEMAFKTYDLMSNMAYTHATPTLFNSGTPKNALSSCFIGETKILTDNGVKNIKDVSVGDVVLTHKNNYKKVKQVHKNLLGDRTLFEMKCFKTPKLVVTGNHEFMSLTKEKIEWGHEPNWNSVEMLRVGDYIKVPNGEGIENELKLIKLTDHIKDVEEITGYTFEYVLDENDNITLTSLFDREIQLPEGTTKTVTYKYNYKNNRMKNTIVKDEDYYKFLGIWIGDGCYLKRSKTNGEKVISGLQVTSSTPNTELINWLRWYASEKLGVEIRLYESKSDKSVKIEINNILLANIFYSFYNEGFAGKKMDKDFIRLNKKLYEQFFIGLVSSDGVVTKEGDIRITLSNIDLVREIYEVGRSLGFKLSFTQSESIKKNATSLTATISIPKKSDLIQYVMKHYDDNRMEKAFEKQSFNTKYYIHNGETYTRIDSKKHYNGERPEYVYTLGVEDDHSYNIGGVIAKNCFLLDMKEDSIPGIFQTLEQAAKISQHAGGLGLAVSKIRASGSYINGTGGTSNGLIPMLRVFNNAMRYVDQCFTGDSKVMTKEGLVEFSNLKNGMEVLTSDGEFHSILNVNEFELGDKEIYKIESEVGESKVTGEHIFLCVRNASELSDDDIRIRIDKGILSLEWVEAKEIQNGDVILNVK